MSTEMIALIALIGIGAVFGGFTARSSIQREAIHGGPIARASNYISAALMAALTPTVLCSITVFELGLWALLIAVVMVILAVVALIPYAIVELPAMQATAAREDRGWTEEDARTSGL